MNFFQKLHLGYEILLQIFHLTKYNAYIAYRLDGYSNEEQLHIINTILHQASQDIYNHPVNAKESK